jgi:phosphopantetheinyl transferase
MEWLDEIRRAASLPAAWLMETGESPRTLSERRALRRKISLSVLEAQLGDASADIAHDAAGRPIVTGMAHLSISHATRDGLALVALGRQRIGADVERVGAGPIPFSALHRAEQRWLHELAEADRELEFARLWAAKEAHGKWTGEGIGETDRHAVLPAGGGAFQAAGSASVRIVTRIAARQGRLYALAVASE